MKGNKERDTTRNVKEEKGEGNRRKERNKSEKEREDIRAIWYGEDWAAPRLGPFMGVF